MDKLNRRMSTDQLYRGVQEYLSDDKVLWGAIPKLSSNTSSRTLFLNIPGAQIRFYLDYSTNSYMFAHSDLDILFWAGDEKRLEDCYAYSYAGRIDYKNLFINNVKGMRELAESVYERAYAMEVAQILGPVARVAK